MAASDPSWLTHARLNLGLKEVKAVKGPVRDDPFILHFWTRARILKKKDATPWTPDNDETPWCAAFVGAMLADAGLAGTGSAMARSYERWGTPVMNADPRKPWGHLPLGAIVVLNRPGAGPRFGHVAFAVGVSNVYGAVQLLGGNQSDSVGIHWFPKSRIVGVRWPAGRPFTPYVEEFIGPIQLKAPTVR